MNDGLITSVTIENMAAREGLPAEATGRSSLAKGRIRI